MRIVKTRRGVRLVEHGLVVSEVVRDPGPTHSLFDSLAAVIAALSPGVRVAVLGFAAGGLVAPLRAMGFGHPLEAVDLSLEGEQIFREHSGPWVGDVRVHEDDAVRWLRRSRRRWNLILEDLSVPVDRDTTKPAASIQTLPALMKSRLAEGGVAAFNVLPVPGYAWKHLHRRIAEPWGSAQVVEFDEWENHLLLAGALPTARKTSRELKRHLAAIGSDQADGLQVRTLDGRRRSLPS